MRRFKYISRLNAALAVLVFAVVTLSFGYTASAETVKYEVYNDGIFTGITKVVRCYDTGGSTGRYISAEEIYRLGLWAEDTDDGVRISGGGKTIDLYYNGKSTKLDGYTFENAVLDVSGERYLMLDVIGMCFSEDYRITADGSVLKIFFDVTADEKVKACTAVKVSPELYDFESGFFTVSIKNDTYFGFDGVNVYTAYYDGDGRLEKTDLRRIYTVEPKSERKVVFPVGGTFDEARSVRIMLWDEDNMPLTKVIDIKKYSVESLELPTGNAEEREILFNDITVDDELYEAVYVMNKNYGDIGYFNGYEDGEFKPNGTVTKSEFCHMLTGLIGIDFDCAEVLYEFADVGQSHWAKNAVSYAVSKGLMTEENGYFYPNGAVGSNEALQAFLRLLGEKNVTAENTAALAEERGLLSGIDRSGTEITRGECTLLAYNFVKIYRNLR